MKNIIVLNVLFLSLFVSTNGLAQTHQKWTYLFGLSNFTIERTGTQVIGANTLAKFTSNFGDTILLKESGDSVYFCDQTDTSYYFMYAYDAQVGDVWHPLLFCYGSFVNECDSLNQLVVVNIDSILISGDWLKRISLYQSQGGYQSQIIENIGPWGDVGFLYNNMNKWFFTCDPNGVIDYWGPRYCFQSYEDDTHSYSKPYACNLGLDANDTPENEPQILRKDNRIEVTWNEKDVDLELYNISGQKVKSAQKNNLTLPQEQGIYFLHIQQNTLSRVVKLAH